MVETPAELPFIEDQVVCLSHNQAARNGPASMSWTGQTDADIAWRKDLLRKIGYKCSGWMSRSCTTCS